MSRFRNETGGVLTVNDLSARVGPGEEFDWPDHDPEVHGLIPGCTWLDAPPDEDDTATEDGEAAAGTAAEDNAGSEGSAEPPGGTSASEPPPSRRRRNTADKEQGE